MSTPEGEPKRCLCGADDRQSARYGHLHLAWCPLFAALPPATEQGETVKVLRDVANQNAYVAVVRDEELGVALQQVKSLKVENEHLRCSILGLHHWRECSLNASTGLKQHPMICERCRAEAAESQVQQLREALAELLATLQREAPGTPLNHHRFDALGAKCHAALAASPVSPQPKEQP